MVFIEMRELLKGGRDGERTGGSDLTEGSGVVMQPHGRVRVVPN